MMGTLGDRLGGASGYKRGRLRMRKTPIPLFTLQNIVGQFVPGPPLLASARIDGLSCQLAIAIAVGIATTDNLNSLIVYPAAPGTVNATPQLSFPGFNRVQMKPVTLTPQLLPYQFIFRPGPSSAIVGLGSVVDGSMPDTVQVDVAVDPNQYHSTFTDGAIVLCVTVEYIGSWWDPDAIEAVMSDVVVTEAQTQIITTGSED